MKTILSIVAFSIFLSSLLCAQEEKKMLVIAQPVDLVSAVVTARRAAVSKGKKIEDFVVTYALYFGDEALAQGNLRRKFWEDFAKEKGIKIPCWVIGFSPKAITANRVDDYTEGIGVTVFVSAANEAAVLDFREEDLP